MSHLREASFSAVLQARRGEDLIPFIVAGDPDLETTDLRVLTAFRAIGAGRNRSRRSVRVIRPRTDRSSSVPPNVRFAADVIPRKSFDMSAPFSA